MIILGIDPGSVKMGWGVVSLSGRAIAPVAFGVVRMSSATPLIDRLLNINTKLLEVLAAHEPQEAAVESLFQSLNKNFQSVITLGQARGAALLTLASRSVRVAEYPPAEVKKSLTGHGRAEKDQVREMVRSLLRMKEIPAEDASDALAVAVTHALRLQSPFQWPVR